MLIFLCKQGNQMSNKSITTQMIILTSLFIIFATALFFQIYFSNLQQAKATTQNKESNKIILDYLLIEKQEQDIYKQLNIIISREKSAIQDSEIKVVRENIQKWYVDLKQWIKNINDLKNKSIIFTRHNFFNEAFVANKERQAEAYRKIVDLCEKSMLKNAKYATNIEAQFLPPLPKTVGALLSGINEKIKIDLNKSQRFYKFTVISFLISISLILFVSFKTFGKVIVNLNSLKKGAERVKKGDYALDVKISGAKELINLADSFNDMQKTIKKDAAEIKALNDSLEGKVEERNQTIMNQNISLQRKNQELEQILYAASHDLRTPLISIQGFSEELKFSCDAIEKGIANNATKDEINEIIEDEIKMSLNYIINGSKRMEVLLEGLLRLSRLGKDSLQVVEIDMNELIKNVSDSMTIQLNEADIDFKIDSLEMCNADRSAIEQIFNNLITNAIKYRSLERKPTIHISSIKNEKITRFTVKDNGIGIDEDNIGKIFNAFFRINEDLVAGDGIGLAIAHRAADLHGGNIKVKSILNQGSEFILEIPNNLITS